MEKRRTYLRYFHDMYLHITLLHRVCERSSGAIRKRDDAQHGTTIKHSVRSYGHILCVESVKEVVFSFQFSANQLLTINYRLL